MTVPRHALVLAAGVGSRLRPLTFVRAKPAIPVAGEPMIRRILRWLAFHRVTNVVLNLHHLPDTITSVVGDGSELAVAVRYSWEHPRILDSAGGPRLALPIVGASTFFIVNGDTLTDVDLAALVEAHRRSSARVTLAVAPHHDPQRYRGLLVDRELRVTGSVDRGSSEPSMHFTGVQVVEADVFSSLRVNEPVRTIGGIYDDLIRSEPGAVRAWPSATTFWDMGTAADYWRMWHAFARAERTETREAPGMRIGSSARVTRSILWDDVQVEEGATVNECIVTDGVVVPRHTSFRRQLLVRPRGRDALFTAPLAVE